MSQERSLADFKAKIEKFATELAEKMNFVPLGGQVKIDVTIIPTPDVLVNVAVETEKGWFVAQIVELTDNDWSEIQGLESPPDLQFLKDRLVAAGNEGIRTSGTQSRLTHTYTQACLRLNSWFGFEKKLPFCVVKTNDRGTINFRLLRKK